MMRAGHVIAQALYVKRKNWKGLYYVLFRGNMEENQGSLDQSQKLK